MCDPVSLTFALGGLQVAQGVASAQQARAQGRYQQRVAERNAQVQENQAADARARGVVAGEEQRDRARQVAARQATGLAASGLDISSGTSLDLFSETATLGEFDAQVAENNAFRQALGFETRAEESRIGGRNARQAGRNRATSALLTAGARAAGTFNQQFGG